MLGLARGGRHRNHVSTGTPVEVQATTLTLLLCTGALGAATGGGGSTFAFENVCRSAWKACWAPAKSPDCRAWPMAVKSASRWVFRKGVPFLKGPFWPRLRMAWKACLALSRFPDWSAPLRWAKSVLPVLKYGCDCC